MECFRSFFLRPHLLVWRKGQHATSCAGRNYLCQHSSIIRIGPPAQRGVLPRGKRRPALSWFRDIASYPVAGTPSVRSSPITSSFPAHGGKCKGVSVGLQPHPKTKLTSAVQSFYYSSSLRWWAGGEHMLQHTFPLLLSPIDTRLAAAVIDNVLNSSYYFCAGPNPLRLKYRRKCHLLTRDCSPKLSPSGCFIRSANTSSSQHFLGHMYYCY